MQSWQFWGFADMWEPDKYLHRFDLSRHKPLTNPSWSDYLSQTNGVHWISFAPDFSFSWQMSVYFPFTAERQYILLGWAWNDDVNSVTLRLSQPTHHECEHQVNVPNNTQNQLSWVQLMCEHPSGDYVFDFGHSHYCNFFMMRSLIPVKFQALCNYFISVL